jgi:hypothetical protein
VLVRLDHDRIAPAPRHLDGGDLLGQAAARLCGGGLGLTPKREAVLVLARDLWSSREIWCSSATFSAVSPMASVPQRRSMAGLTKRQPSVVS